MATSTEPVVETVTGVACAHCGLPVLPGLVVSGADTQFCCTGCHTAYTLLHEHGLASYYALGEQRGSAVRSTGRSYEEFDHPAFESLYVRRTADGMADIELYLEGVHCASCVWLVERVPLLLAGVARAELDIRRSLARVTWDPAALPLSQIARTLDTLGYPPHPYRGVAREAMRTREDRAQLLRIGVAGAIAINVMLPAIAMYAGWFNGMEANYERFFRWISLGLTVPAVVWPGRVFFTSAWAALRTRRMHMDVPIALALTLGLGRGAVNTITDTGPVYFDAVTILIFLLLVGRYLQHRGTRLATDAAELLYALAPQTARVIEDGVVRETPAAALLPGMLLEVRPGENFPADGTVDETSARSAVNAALLTGESRPVSVGAGDTVYAGTLNVSAPLRVRVTEAGASSRVAKILQQVEESAARRAPVVLLANRIAGWFIVTIVLLAVATYALWAGNDSAAALDHAIALLVVTCPCALVMATPLAVTVAVGRAARRGIFVKGGDAIERLSHPDLLVLDKTGTVTVGDTSVAEWVGDERVRPLVVALEGESTHPIAEAFRRAWPELQVPHVESSSHVVGGGMRGRVDGHDVIVGSPRFVRAELGLASDAPMPATSAHLTPVVIAVDGAMVAAAGIGDRVRDDAAAALATLRARGWRTMLLSGDDPRVVAHVGAALGFAPDAVIGGATPETKLAFIEARVRERTGAVVMVGDGVNDAAAIAAADCGIGVHGGAEACLTSADAYLTTPGLTPLVELFAGADRTMRVIRRNMGFALAYNALAVGLAMFGLLNPVIAAIMMPLSSLTVVLGAWRGRTFEVPRAVRAAGPVSPVSVAPLPAGAA
ncbi:MAG: heavy metal translocating P-type ATPase [Gemmatimonadaceae bacterium]|jgi:Cu2+-exporting ATPase|nr:heavy metal translocating P-type ATPase [Gemmatimonadaceae bacterium]